MKVSVVNNSFIPLAIKVRHNQSSVSPYWTRSTRPKEGINPFVASFRLRAIPNAKQKDTGKYMAFHMFVMNQSQCAMQHTSTRRQRLAHTITNGSQATCVHIQVYECLYILLVFLLFVSSAPQFASTHIVRARTSTTISIRVVRVARNRARNAVSCASTHIVYTYRVERRKKKKRLGKTIHATYGRSEHAKENISSMSHRHEFDAMGRLRTRRKSREIPFGENPDPFTAENVANRMPQFMCLSEI